MGEPVRGEYVMADGSLTMTYDAENRMTATGGVTYSYDGDGKRVKKSNGKLYWYGASGLDALLETDLAGNTPTEFVFFGGKRIARRDSGGAVSYFFADHLGSSRVVTNATGTTVLDDSDFYPFGGERVVVSNDPNPYKFTGKERDTESTLDYFGARYYASAQGRFVSPDLPFADQDRNQPQSWNLYGYVRSNPLKFIDPNGRWTTGVHNWIIDQVFRGVSASTRQILKDASEAVDQDQDPGGAYKHGMRSPGQSALSAQMQTDAFVSENLRQAVEQQMMWEAHGASGDSRAAVWHFGEALHAVTDSASREHAGSQEWAGMGFLSLSQYVSGNNVRAAGHGIREWRHGNLPGGSSQSALAMAKYQAALLWTRYQKMLEKEREKQRQEEEERRKKEGRKKKRRE